MRLPERPDGAPRELALELPATHGAVRQARTVVRSFARLDGVGSDEVDRMALVVTELLGNAVDHGGGGAAMDPSELTGDVRMQLKLELFRDRWTLEVTDEGDGSADGSTDGSTNGGSGRARTTAAGPAPTLDPEALASMSDEDITAAIEAKLTEAEGDQVPDLQDERGRGFFLIREMVDELEVVDREGETGRVVRVVRRYGGA